MQRDEFMTLLMPEYIEDDYRELLYSALENQEFGPQYLMVGAWFLVGPQNNTLRKVERNTSNLVGLGAGFSKGRKALPLDMLIPWAMNYIVQYHPIPDTLYESISISFDPPTSNTVPELNKYFARVLRDSTRINQTMLTDVEYLALVGRRARKFSDLINLGYVMTKDNNMDFATGHIHNERLYRTQDIAAMSALWEHWIMVQDAWKSNMEDRMTWVDSRRYQQNADPRRFLERFEAELAEQGSTSG